MFRNMLVGVLMMLAAGFSAGQAPTEARKKELVQLIDPGTAKKLAELSATMLNQAKSIGEAFDDAQRIIGKLKEDIIYLALDQYEQALALGAEYEALLGAKNGKCAPAHAAFKKKVKDAETVLDQMEKLLLITPHKSDTFGARMASIIAKQKALEAVVQSLEKKDD